MSFVYAEAWGVGVMPLLMHGFNTEAEAGLPGGSGKGTRTVATAAEKPLPREIAEKFAYRENGPQSSLVLPRDAFQRLLREAARATRRRDHARRSSIAFRRQCSCSEATRRVLRCHSSRKIARHASRITRCIRAAPSIRSPKDAS